MNKSRTDTTLSPWTREIDQALGHSLDSDIECDICVVGAGIGGLTTAYLLQKNLIIGPHNHLHKDEQAAVKKVCVVEAFAVGSGQTGRTTAQFSTALDDRYFEIEKYHGLDGARLAAESHLAAIDIAHEIIRNEQIDCDSAVVDGYLFRAPDSPADVLLRERDACHRAGLKDVRWIQKPTGDTFLKNENEVLCFPGQLQLDPLRYINGIAQAFEASCGRIFTNSPVEKLSGGSGDTRDRDALVMTKSGHKIRCSSIVVATNSPINDIFAIHTKQAPYRSYVIAIRVPIRSVPKALYWDTLEAYHYVRLVGEDLLVVGGEDHKTGQDHHPDGNFDLLEKWTREKVPAALEVVYRWSGQVMESTDGLGFLGHNPLDRNNVYIITGDSGNGMTHATIGAALINDQINGRANSWESLYSPSRKSIRAGLEFLKENANVAAQYLDWLTPKASSHLESMPDGSAALVREGVHISAVYKNEMGVISKCSAVCPHLGAIVHWNPVELTWDCPCHGSRFTALGRVIEGPATMDLAVL